MRSLRAWLLRIGGLFRRKRHERELDEELEGHLALHVADNLRGGLAPEEARRRALVMLGGLEAAKQRYREQRGVPWLESTWQDLGFALRLLRKSPGLTIAAVVPLALAIGTATALFSVVNGVLLRPLPYGDVDRLVIVAEHRQGNVVPLSGNVRSDTFRAWRDDGTTIDEIAVFGGPFKTLWTGEEAVRLRVGTVSASLFELLGVSPLRGRFIRPDEDRADARPVVVLSHHLWQRRFGGDEQILGRSITLDDRSYVVVGITPPGFYFPDRDTELWLSHALDLALTQPNLGGRWNTPAIARLTPGATVAQAEAEATAIARQIDASERQTDPAGEADDETAPHRVWLVGVLESAAGSIRTALLILLGAVLAVLVVASANVAGLLLVRSLARRRELAVRAALGATAGRLARELFAGSVLVGLAGGTVGVLVAVALHHAFPALAPSDFPRIDDVVLDWRVAAFGIVVAVAATVLCGVAPAWYGGRLNLVETLNESGTAAPPRARRLGVGHVRIALVAGELALSCVLLLMAGLFARSFVSLTAIDPGYDPSGVLTAQVGLQTTEPAAAHQEVTRRLLQRLKASSAVRAVGMTSTLPLETATVVFTFQGEDGDPSHRFHFRLVSAGYFEAMGMRLAAGRAFTEADTAAGPRVAVVNEAFVRERLADRDPVNALFPPAGGRNAWTIVGVIEDVRDRGPLAEPQPTLYMPYLQREQTFFNRIDVAVRTAGDPSAFASTLATIVRELDPRLALYDVRTMQARLSDTTARTRLYSWSLGAFALVAVAVTAIGLYGLLAYAVSQRRREVAVRVALGARAGHVLRLLLRQGAGVALTGIGIGVGIGAGGTRFLNSFLFGVGPLDPVTFLTVPALLVAIAGLAWLVPALRALRVQPASTLRAQ